MAFAAVPRPAAAGNFVIVNFVLTVWGPSPSGDTLALSLETPPFSGQLHLFCGPASAGGPNPSGPCQGGGKTYTVGLDTPSGTKGFYQFQDVDPSGGLIILKEGSFTAPAGPEELTINAIFGTPPAQQQCGCGTGPGFGPPLPNTAVAPGAGGSEAVLPALGLLIVLLAAAMSARRRHGELPATISAE